MLRAPDGRAALCRKVAKSVHPIARTTFCWHNVAVPAEIPPIITPEQAAQLLHCSPRTIEDRLRSGDLPGEKFGDGWILPAEALIARVNEISVKKMLERREPATPTAIQYAQRPSRREPPPLF